jgi:hypothetical protein
VFPNVQGPVGADRTHRGEKTLHLGRRRPEAFQSPELNRRGAARVLHGDALDRFPKRDPLFREIQRDPALMADCFEIRKEAFEEYPVARISGKYHDS